MSSILPGFEYDIFISYRHNDNLPTGQAGHDGWVSEFVQNLEKELKGTLKDSLTIYFDKSPHDGLLETHNVDKSLESKLKCLIFIPIVSQTYCDPKSFAWQHEFCAFNKQAKDDQFGRDIKLSSGNVSSRILPVKIHDLDAEDRALLEKELGGVLRSIEFIQKSGGVNRPLNPKDDEVRMTDKILYRDQVNKVANAVKEIVGSLRNPATNITPGSNRHSVVGPDSNKDRPGSAAKKLIFASIVAFLLAAAGYFFYEQRSTDPDSNQDNQPLDKSIAVLPFADMSADHDQEYFGDGMAEEIINVLTQIPDLKVISRTSSFQFKGKNEDLRKIGEVLGVTTILEGSVRKSNNKIRITAQLINTTGGTHVWSKTYDRNADDILNVQDEIAREVVGALKITLSGALKATGHNTSNEEAYNVYLQARYFFDQVSVAGNTKAMELFKRTIELDSTFAPGWAGLSLSKWRINGGSAGPADWEEIKALTNKALQLDPNLAEGYLNLSLFARSEYDLLTAQKQIIKAYQIEPKNPRVLRNYGFLLLVSGKFAEGIDLSNKAVVIDPVQSGSYRYLARAYYYAGRIPEAYEAFEKSYALSPAATPTIGQMEFANAILRLKGAPALLEQMGIEKNEVIKLAGTAIAYSILGKENASDQALARLKEGYATQNAYEIAQVFAFRNDKRNALQWLQQAYNQKELSITALKIDPVFKSLREEKEFIDLLKNVKFPE